MDNAQDILAYAIDEQLAEVRKGLLLSTPASDEERALQQFETELHDWRGTLKRNAEPDLEEQPPSKRARTAQPAKEYLCSLCLDQWPLSAMQLIRACKSRYCNDCFAFMLENSITSQEIIRCCNRNVRPSRNFRQTHRQACDEYDKLYKELDADNPMYCTNTACSAFLGNFKRLKHKVTCKSCGTESCASCRLPMKQHIHQLCPDDVDHKMMQQAVVTYRMKRCPNCFLVVDKNGGCNNVRCKCGTMFCYVCGERKGAETDSCGCFRRAAA